MPRLGKRNALGEKVQNEVSCLCSKGMPAMRSRPSVNMDFHAGLPDDY
jgi:hypothetical protein